MMKIKEASWLRPQNEQTQHILPGIMQWFVVKVNEMWLQHNSGIEQQQGYSRSKHVKTI